MQLRVSLTSNYDDHEKGSSFPDVEMSIEYNSRIPNLDEVKSLFKRFEGVISDDTKPAAKVRELG
jgi:hypothetical protein